MNVIIVADSKTIRDSIKTLLLRLPNIQLTDTDDIAEALHTAQMMQIDFFILDIDMPLGKGLALLDSIKTHNIGGKVIILTDHSHRGYDTIATALGAEHIIDKSAKFEKVLGLFIAGVRSP